MVPHLCRKPSLCLELLEVQTEHRLCPAVGNQTMRDSASFRKQNCKTLLCEDMDRSTRKGNCVVLISSLFWGAGRGCGGKQNCKTLGG